MPNVPVQEHVLDPLTQVCVHCHVPMINIASGPISCVYRWVDAASVAKLDRPQMSAVNDFDFIGARLRQLREEREAEVVARRDET